MGPSPESLLHGGWHVLRDTLSGCQFGVLVSEGVCLRKRQDTPRFTAVEVSGMRTSASENGTEVALSWHAITMGRWRIRVASLPCSKIYGYSGGLWQDFVNAVVAVKLQHRCPAPAALRWS